jgi:hypothetical protein
MPDQGAGSTNTESLSQQTSQQNTPKPILNHPASSKMNQWKSSFMKYLSSRSPTMAKAQPLNPGQTPKTLPGAVNMNVAGGPKEVQYAQAQRQPIANPAGAADNSGMTVSAAYNPPKEASMNRIDPRRVETVRALLKFAACMNKNKKKKKKLFGKRAEEEVPGVSVAAPMTAAGIGAGSEAMRQSTMRNFPSLYKHAPQAQKQQLRQVFKANPGALEALIEAGRASKLRAYGAAPALAGATLAAPVWAGAASAKREGGAGRGAAVGAGTGAGVATAASLIGALLARKTPGLPTQILKSTPGRAAGGAGIGAIGGAIGGGVQKRRRTKSQEKKKSKESKESKGEKKEAHLKHASKWGLGRILGLGAIGLGAGTFLPPLSRGLRHKTEMAVNPMYKQQHDMQKAMYNPAMMQLMMLRNMGGYGGMNMPPIMSPEDRQMYQQATYLKSLRSRARALQEMYE